MANKVIYGLKNVSVWPITAEDENGVPTYGARIKMPGAVSMQADPESETHNNFGDDGSWWTSVSHAGYTGTSYSTISLISLLQKFLARR